MSMFDFGPGLSNGPGINNHEPRLEKNNTLIETIETKELIEENPEEDPLTRFIPFLEFIKNEQKHENQNTEIPKKDSLVDREYSNSTSNFQGLSSLLALVIIGFVSFSVFNSLFEASSFNTNSTLLVVQNTLMPLFLLTTIFGIFIALFISLGRWLPFGILNDYLVFTFFPLNPVNGSEIDNER